MKTGTKIILLLLTLLMIGLILFDNNIEKTDTAIEKDDIEDGVVDTEKATAIFWIDKAELKHCREYGFRTVKAKVFIREDGTVDLLSFVKKQSPAAERYIRHHLAKFQVTERMFESGYMHPGEQFVQLRCILEMLKEK